MAQDSDECTGLGTDRGLIDRELSEIRKELAAFLRTPDVSFVIHDENDLRQYSYIREYDFRKGEKPKYVQFLDKALPSEKEDIFSQLLKDRRKDPRNFPSHEYHQYILGRIKSTKQKWLQLMKNNKVCGLYLCDKIINELKNRNIESSKDFFSSVISGLLLPDIDKLQLIDSSLRIIYSCIPYDRRYGIDGYFISNSVFNLGKDKRPIGTPYIIHEFSGKKTLIGEQKSTLKNNISFKLNTTIEYSNLAGNTLRKKWGKGIKYFEDACADFASFLEELLVIESDSKGMKWAVAFPLLDQGGQIIGVIHIPGKDEKGVSIYRITNDLEEGIQRYSHAIYREIERALSNKVSGNTSELFNTKDKRIYDLLFENLHSSQHFVFSTYWKVDREKVMLNSYNFYNSYNGRDFCILEPPVEVRNINNTKNIDLRGIKIYNLLKGWNGGLERGKRVNVLDGQSESQDYCNILDVADWKQYIYDLLPQQHADVLLKYYKQWSIEPRSYLNPSCYLQSSRD